MSYNFNTFAIFSIITTFFTLLVFVYGIFNYSSRKYSFSFLVFSIFAFVISLASFATLVIEEYSIALVWGYILYIGTVFAPVALLILVNDFIHKGFFRRKPNLKYFLYIIPVGLSTLYLLKGIDLINSRFGYIMGPQKTTSFITPLFLTAIYIIIIIILSFEINSRKKEAKSLGGTKILLIGIAIYLFGQMAFMSLDVESLVLRFQSYTISPLILFIFIFISFIRMDISIQQLSLIKIIDNIEDSVIVSDNSGDILRINRSMKKKLFCEDRSKISDEDLRNQISNTMKDKSSALDFLSFLKNSKVDRFNKDIQFKINRKEYIFNVSCSTIFDKNNRSLGKLSIFRDITQRSKLDKKIRYLSFHDTLTGLYNRRFFEEELKRMDTPRQLPLSIIMADIDGLKMVNDKLGHKKGDKLIINVSNILRRSNRKEDIVARWGGDEFIILLPGTDSEKAEKIVERNKDYFRNDKQKNGMPINVSLGLATKTEPEEDIENIIEKADENMYMEKAFNKEKDI